MIVPIANEDFSTWRGIFCQVISLTCVMAPLWQEARTTSGAGPDVMMTYRKVSEPISLYNRWLSFWWKDALFVYIFSVLMSLKVVFSDRCVICLPICSFFFNVQHLDDVHSRNVMRYMQAINQYVQFDLECLR